MGGNKSLLENIFIALVYVQNDHGMGIILMYICWGNPPTRPPPPPPWAPSQTPSPPRHMEADSGAHGGQGRGVGKWTPKCPSAQFPPRLAWLGFRCERRRPSSECEKWRKWCKAIGNGTPVVRHSGMGGRRLGRADCGFENTPKTGREMQPFQPFFLVPFSPRPRGLQRAGGGGGGGQM